MRNDDWWRVDHSGGTQVHGNYNYRLPTKAFGTNMVQGYSMWHLLAIQALSDDVVSLFLESASSVKSDILIDDLTECMTVFPSIVEECWITNSSGKVHKKYYWQEIRELTAWKNPIQISQLLNKPLIQWDLRIIDFKLHPVIQAAQTLSIQNLKT